MFDKMVQEYKKLPLYNKEKIDKLSKIHRNIYYKFYYLGIKYPRLNILNLVYIYFFKNYYLYQLDEKYLVSINDKLENFEEDKKDRIRIVDFYIQNLQDIKNIKLPKLNNKENILSRLTIKIDSSEEISKKIRDNKIPSNTMYPMLVDRFKLFFDKNEYQNSYRLKGRLLNLWTNNIDSEQIDTSIELLKGLKGGIRCGKSLIYR
ncbi:MAG: DegT/DnrJ/EryC1/StrS family aminotransferase [Candidatus Gracilibacteria bacterium]